jgi:hypothetical protein
MPPLPLSKGMYGRPRLGQPLVRAVNCLFEETPGGPGKDIRFTRPGLTHQYAIGAGPILKAYQVPGLYNGDPLFISGGALYRKNTLVGTTAYGQFPRLASAQNKTAIVSGGGLYVYDGTTLTQVQFFDDGVSRLPPFGGVAVLYNIFVFFVVGSQQFYFSSVGDPTTINAANFSNAQVSSDNIVEVAVLGEELYFFKGSTVEIWDYTGQLTAPFAESQGRTYAKGCASQNSVQGYNPAPMDNALAWIGDDLVAYRTSTVPTRFSSPLVEDRLRAAGLAGVAQLTSLVLQTEGHVIYVINLPTINESWAHDFQTGEWFQWGTQDGQDAEPGIWRAGVACGRGDKTYIGSYNSPDIYLSDVNKFADDQTPLRMVVAGAIWLQAGFMRCNNISLQCVRGVATAGVPDPEVAMRWSDDGGMTWTSWLYELLAFVGSYDYKATWRNLGIINQPGRLVEFTVSDAVNFTVQGATVNEARV